MSNDLSEQGALDGHVHLERIENGLRLRVDHADREQTIELSYYNAERVLRALAFLLGIQLRRK